MEWRSIQQAIQGCRRCEVEHVSYLSVPCGAKREPTWEPVHPVRLYFVSVAPPWGGAYFWDETKRDAVREGLFKALHGAIPVEIRNCEEFRANRLFLSPAVKCPSTKNDKDHSPSLLSVTTCSNCAELGCP